MHAPLIQPQPHPYHPPLCRLPGSTTSACSKCRQALQRRPSGCGTSTAGCGPPTVYQSIAALHRPDTKITCCTQRRRTPCSCLASTAPVAMTPSTTKARKLMHPQASTSNLQADRLTLGSNDEHFAEHNAQARPRSIAAPQHRAEPWHHQQLLLPTVS